MAKIIYGGLIKKRINLSRKENEYDKKLEKSAIIANIIAKKTPNFKKFKPFIYGDLYKKRIAENEKEDIVQDFTSIITSFCAKLYGQRRSKRKI